MRNVATYGKKNASRQRWRCLGNIRSISIFIYYHLPAELTRLRRRPPICLGRAPWKGFAAFTSPVVNTIKKVCDEASPTRWTGHRGEFAWVYVKRNNFPGVVVNTIHTNRVVTEIMVSGVIFVLNCLPRRVGFFIIIILQINYLLIKLLDS